MLKKQPIFILKFARDASNLLLYLFLSYPDMCIDRGEPYQILQNKKADLFQVRITDNKKNLLSLILKNINYISIMFLDKRDVFIKNHQSDICASLKPETRKLIERILLSKKLKAISPGDNLYKTERTFYTRDQIRSSRLLGKSLDRFALLSQELAYIYLGATFIALVRNGLAICKAKIRRGKDPTIVNQQYHAVCQQMIKYSTIINNDQVDRYKSLANYPQYTLLNILA
jgi:hypothetical protein